MAYLGNTPTTQSFISGTDYFNGTGAQTAFTLTRTVASVNDIEAVVNNVVQQPNDAYNISGTTITFTSAPSAGTNNVYVRYLSTTTQAITPSQNTVNYNTFDSNMQSAIGTGMKNRIINGAMVIDQRNAGASVSLTSGGGNTYSADRWYVENNTDGTATIQQITDAPTGFSNSIRYTVTATDTSLASDQSAFIQQRIEGFNFADMLYGTANAKTVTVSFWVKSSVTGTFGVTLANSAYNRGYPASFTVSAANTWEQKSVTITGDTTGTWIGSTNGTGVRVSFGMAAGSARASASGAWAAATVIGVNSQVNLMATNGATFQVSGVQLEVGTQATSFEYRQYGQELALCQRYCERLENRSYGLWVSANGLRVYPKYQVRKRATTTATLTTTTPYAEQIGVAGVTGSGSTITNNSTVIDGGDFSIDGFSGRVYGQFAFIESGTILVTAEL